MEGADHYWSSGGAAVLNARSSIARYPLRPLHGHTVAMTRLNVANSEASAVGCNGLNKGLKDE